MLVKVGVTFIIIFNGFVAQLVEQLTLNQLVVGSSPTEPTSISASFLNNVIIESTASVIEL